MGLRAWWRGRRYHRDNWRAVEDDQWAAQLRADLHAAADAVEPDPGGLDVIWERLGHESYAWPVVQPDLGVAAALPGPPPGEPTAAELGAGFMGGLEDHMARQAPEMWAEWYEDYATLRFREFMAQWFGAR